MADPTLTCIRCARQPRDEEDLASWVSIGMEDVCPGCLTLTEADALRNADR